MYESESWTIKKVERWRIDAIELWCWRRLLRVPWTSRRSNQSILKEMSPGCSLEGLMLKLKLQYFGHLMRRTDTFEKTLMLGKIEGRRKSGRQMVGWHHWLSGHEFEKAPGVGDGQGGLVCCSPSSRKESDMTKWFNWTEDPAENPSESYKGLTALPERSQEGTGRCCPKVNSQRQEFFSVFWNQCDETEFFDETRWTWIWANSERQWRTEVSGMLQSTRSQRVRHDLATEQ